MTGSRKGARGHTRSASSRPSHNEDEAIRRDHVRRDPDKAAGQPDLDVAAPFRPAPGGFFRVGLKTRADFLRAAKGRRAHGRSMSLQIFRRPDESAAAARFGLTVTRKVGGAVERNRIKRRLRAVLRTPDLKPQPGHDYVVVARREALTMPFPALVADLARALDPSRHSRKRSVRAKVRHDAPEAEGKGSRKDQCVDPQDGSPSGQPDETKH